PIVALDPEDPDVPSEWKSSNLVLGLAQLEADQRAAVADRESQHLDVEQLRRGKVSELVDQHEHADEQQKIQDGHSLKTARRAYSRTGILPLRGDKVGTAGAREGGGHRGSARRSRHHARSREGAVRAVLPGHPEAAADVSAHRYRAQAARSGAA